MNLLRNLVLSAILLFLPVTVGRARLMEALTYQQLLDRSDLVVLATPVRTGDTKEEIDLPGYTAMRAIGVETQFKVLAVLKGDKAIQHFVFHHYRSSKPNVGYENGPTLVAFDPAKPRSFLIFLIREADGRYAPVGGQTDPAHFAVHEIGGILK